MWDNWLTGEKQNKNKMISLIPSSHTYSARLFYYILKKEDILKEVENT